MSALIYDRAVEPRYGEAVDILPHVRRVTAHNPGPFTFLGTNSWVLGAGPFVVVDPGPLDDAHCAALIAATSGHISHILVTHTHRDHSPGAAILAERTGALIAGCGPHMSARDLEFGEVNPLEASNDLAFRPQVHMADGDWIATSAGRVRALATPGHTANHLAFVFEDLGVMAVGDHVMSWSTSIIAPPDGSVGDYMASLDRLEALPLDRYLPGHGNAVMGGRNLVRGLRHHRQAREAAILNALRLGPLTSRQIVESVYRDTDPSLHNAAELSVRAQLEWLLARQLVAVDSQSRWIASRL